MYKLFVHGSLLFHAEVSYGKDHNKVSNSSRVGYVIVETEGVKGDWPGDGLTTSHNNHCIHNPHSL